MYPFDCRKHISIRRHTRNHKHMQANIFLKYELFPCLRSLRDICNSIDLYLNIAHFLRWHRVVRFTCFVSIHQINIGSRLRLPTKIRIASHIFSGWAILIYLQYRSTVKTCFIAGNKTVKISPFFCVCLTSIEAKSEDNSTLKSVMWGVWETCQKWAYLVKASWQMVR